MTFMRSDEEETLEQECILPEQFHDMVHRSIAEMSPEKRLMTAIVQDALELVSLARLAGRRNTNLAQEAYQWFFSEDRHWLYSFLTICDYLAVDPHRVRAHVQQHFGQRVLQKRIRWTAERRR